MVFARWPLLLYLLSAFLSTYAQPIDSLTRALDSLEVELLRTTRTYQQIDRLIQSIPLRSENLDLLPSVLPLPLPIEEFKVTSAYGLRRHPIHHRQKFHGGIDVKAAAGTDVTSTAPGLIKQVGYDPTLGAFVRILHAFGFETVYGHLAGYLVQPGQYVTRGEVIGKVGKTGLATGPHLHYTIRKNELVVDPLQFCFLLRRRLWLLQSGSGMRAAWSPANDKI